MVHWGYDMTLEKPGSSMRSFQREARWAFWGTLAMLLGLFACESENPSHRSRTPTEHTVADSMTVVRVLQTDDRFSTLRAVLDSIGLDSTLAREGPYTLFAPPNSAFEALPAGTMEEWWADEPDRLRSLVRQHIAPGRVSRDSLSSISALTMQSGDTLAVQQSGGTLHLGPVRIVDGDVGASNGLLHVVDRVLQPPPDTTAVP